MDANVIDTIFLIFEELPHYNNIDLKFTIIQIDPITPYNSTSAY